MTTPELTLADLVRVLRETAGADESVNLDGDILDTLFADLGYDSLSLLEAASRIEQETGVKLSEDALGEAETPRMFLALINRSVPTRA